MLLNDSVELEYNDYSATAEPLPLNWDIELSQIWIPSCLLPNRKKSINPNENKPYIFHTLEKPDESKGFSVYSHEYSQHHESQTSSAVSQKLMNNNNNKFQIQQVLPTSQNAVESDTKLGISNKEGISPLHPVNRDKLDDSLREAQGIHNLTVENAVLPEKNTSDNCLMQDTYSNASVDDLACRMAQILSEDEPLEADWLHEDVIKANQVTTSSTFDSIPPSTKDSLEDIYYSDEDEDQFTAEEYELENLESKSPENNYASSIYTDNSYVHKQPSESFMNKITDLERAKNNIIKTVCQSFNATTKIPVDKIFKQTEPEELNKIENVVYSNYSEQELQKCEGESTDPTEKIVEFPIAYIRPPLQEHTNKTKPKKEKKKAKKSKINMPLEDLFQSEEVDRFKVPEVDEFYDNLVRQGKCPPRDREIDIDEFPSVNFPKKLQSNVHEFPAINFPEVPQTTLFWDSAQKIIQSTGGELLSSSSQEIIQNEEKTEPEFESNVSLDTIVIDNIHLNVSKETIESVILGYGEVKKLTIEQHGKFQRAILQMDSSCEVDWIIDCLNDSQPFGSFDKELVKCYRQI